MYLWVAASASSIVDVSREFIAKKYAFSFHEITSAFFSELGSIPNIKNS